MKKIFFIAFITIALCSFFLASCPGSFNTSETEFHLPEGMGSLSVHIDDESDSRTILPGMPVFLRYKLTFKQDDSYFSIHRIPSTLSQAIPLNSGSYNLLVIAYLDDGSDSELEKAAAWGELEIDIAAGIGVSHAVTLSPFPATEALPALWQSYDTGNREGIFLWDISWPPGVTDAAMMITPVSAGGTAQQEITFSAGAVTRNTGETVLKSGYYRVLLTLAMPEHQSIQWFLVLHIYQNLESDFIYNFSSDYFNGNVHIVSFDSNGGSDVGSFNIGHGQNYTDTAPKPVPTRPGYTFYDWYAKDGNYIDINTWNDTQYETNWDNVTSPVSRSLTLYARWLKHPAAFDFEITGSIERVYDRNEQDVTVQFSENAEPAINAGSAGTITVFYTGTDTAGNNYNSSTPPVNAGAYEIRASTSGGWVYDTAEKVLIDTLIIEPKPVAINNVTAADRVYSSANTSVVLAGGELQGIEQGDAVSFTLGGGNIANANVILPVVPRDVSTNIQLTGLDRLNYTLIQPDYVKVSISQKPVSITGLSAVPREYNAALTVSITGGALTGIETPDIVTMNIPAEGSIEDPNAGNDKPVVIGFITLGGAHANNYVINQPAGIMVNISPKIISVSGLTAQNRIYNASASVTLTGGALTGVEEIDIPNLGFDCGAGIMSTSDAGENKTVNTSIVLTGDALANYSLTQPANVRVNIAPKELTITGVTAASRIFSAGNTAVQTSGGTLSGVESADSGLVAPSHNPGNIQSANVGTYNVATNIDLSGARASNYTLLQPAGISVIINPAPINTVAITGITAPAAGGTPATASAGTGNFTRGNVTWEPAASAFSGGVSYTARITITANQNYTFPAGLTGTINTNSAIVTVQNSGANNNTASLSYSFPAAARPVIIINTQPAATTNVIQGQITGSLSIAATVNPAGAGPVTYQWFSSTTNSNTGGAPVTGAVNASFNIPANLSGAGSSHYYYCIASAGLGAESVTSSVARVNVTTPINTAGFNVTAPVKNATPNTTATLVSGSGFTFSAVLWNLMLSHDPFRGGTQYTALIVLTANEGYMFPGSFSATINGQPANISIIDTNNIFVSYTFPATAPPVISIIRQPPDTILITSEGRYLYVTTSVDGGGATLSYQWYRNTINSNTGGTLISGATDATYIIPTSNLPATGWQYYYYVEVSATLGAEPVRSNAATVGFQHQVVFRSDSGDLILIVNHNDVIPEAQHPSPPAAATSGYFNRVFEGWFTGPVGSGTKWTEDTVITTGRTFNSYIRSYIIGDIGPAGGFIFYADGNGFEAEGLNETFYYMEAAPADLPETYAWGNTANVSTSDLIGTGKINTDNMWMERPASNACLTYSITHNGITYNDWFLPSEHELRQLFQSRSRIEISDSGLYWSSTQYNTYTTIPNFPFITFPSAFAFQVINPTSFQRVNRAKSDEHLIRPVRYVP